MPLVNVLLEGSSPSALYIAWRLTASRSCQVYCTVESSTRFVRTSFGDSPAFAPKVIDRSALLSKEGPTLDFVILSLESLKHLTRVSKDLSTIISPHHTVILVDVSGGLIPIQDKVRSHFPNNKVSGILCDVTLVWAADGGKVIEQVSPGSNALVEPLDSKNNHRIGDIAIYLQTAGMDAARAKSAAAFTKVQWIKAIPVIAFEPLSILFEISDVKSLKESVMARPVVEGIIDELSAIAAKLGHPMPTSLHFFQTAKLRTSPPAFQYPNAPILFYQYYSRHPIPVDLLLLFPILLSDELKAGKTPYLEVVFSFFSHLMSLNKTGGNHMLLSRAGTEDTESENRLNHQMNQLSLKSDEIAARENAVAARERSLAIKMQDMSSKEHALQAKYQELATRRQEVAILEQSLANMRSRVSPDGSRKSPPTSGDAASTGSSGSCSGSSEEALKRREGELFAREQALRAREQHFISKIKAAPPTAPLPQFNGQFKPPPLNVSSGGANGFQRQIPMQHPARKLQANGQVPAASLGLVADQDQPRVPPMAPERQVPVEDIDMMSMTTKRTRHRSFVKSPSTVMNSSNPLGTRHRMSSPALSMLAHKQSYSQQFDLCDLDNTTLDRYGGTSHASIYSRMPTAPSLRGPGGSRTNSISSQSVLHHRPSGSGGVANGLMRTSPEQTPVLNGTNPNKGVFSMPNGSAASGSSSGSSGEYR